jgi:hypothetical protein
VVRSMVLESRVWGPHSLHTAEVTGSIPVTPTSQNASRARSFGPFARRFTRRPGLGVVASGSRRLIQAVSTPAWRLSSWLAEEGTQHVPLEHPVVPVLLGRDGRFRDMEGEPKPSVERVDHPGGHLRVVCR